LLSLTTNGHSPNIDYNCNLYIDQYRDDDYGEDKTSVNKNSDTSGSKDILDNDNINENNLQEPFMSVNATSPQQTNATNWFQVMLHDLVMRHKASLQMFDDICNLVNDYTSSPDFFVMLKLESQKSFLCSIEEIYCTHRLRPTNHNVRLHGGSSATVLVFDTKQMIISLLTDKLLMNDTNFAEGYNILTGEVDINNPCNSKYRKVHTGDAWLPARNR
jgi:hypothetical protein